MPVRIRLSRVGKKNAPIYRVVVVDSRKKRDGKFIENLGTYNPISKKLEQFKADRINDWITKGALPTDMVKKLQRMHEKQIQAAK